jgi:hypothetical protein
MRSKGAFAYRRRSAMLPSRGTALIVTTSNPLPVYHLGNAKERPAIGESVVHQRQKERGVG